LFGIADEDRVGIHMILVLFIISVGVMELILRRDANKPDSIRTETTKQETTPPPVSQDLLALAESIQRESPAPVDDLEEAVKAQRYNREDVRAH
jgi:hypothetical protein